MKILFLSRYQQNNERGVESFVSELAKRLSKNHQVDIFNGSKADSIKDVLKGKYDVVIPLNGRLQSLKISLARIIGGYKVLISGHSGKGIDDIWNIVVARPDIFVALTNDMLNWAKKYSLGIKLVKIPNGIDLNIFNPQGDKIKIDLPKPIILSVGALVWYKHHERVIEAVSRSKEGSLLIVGKGPLKESLQRLGDLKLKGRFQILNFNNQQMPKVYRSCNLFTLPSWDREAFGIVYLEALASGLGIVAPDDSSRREIINDAGILTDTKYSKIYSENIKKALEVNWEDKALKQAKKFSWDEIAKQYEKALKDLIS